MDKNELFISISLKLLSKPIRVRTLCYIRAMINKNCIYTWYSITLFACSKWKTHSTTRHINNSHPSFNMRLFLWFVPLLFLLLFRYLLNFANVGYIQALVNKISGVLSGHKSVFGVYCRCAHRYFFN